MILITLAYIEGWTYVRKVDGVMAIKPNFLAYFLNNGAPRARAEGARGAPLLRTMPTN